MTSASRGIPRGVAPNAWAARIAERRAAGCPLLDLTIANPTRVGLSGASQEVLAALDDRAAREDHPDPRGLPRARAAVSAYYRERGTPVDADAIVLTTGTSESYAHLFRLLADPGEAVLVPTPSYPLVEPIARLESLEVVPYRLAWDGAWHLDVASLDEALARAGDRARAVIVVEPNHPTGTCLSASEREALETRLEARGLALISDEVFGDFPWPPRAAVFPGWLGERRAPTFVLGGLSKACGLPQLKVGWVALAGPGRAATIEGLEWIADLFLTVSGPAQHALPHWLAGRAAYQRRVRERIARNRESLTRFVARHPEASLLGGEGGWAQVLRLPARDSDPSLALLERDVIVHPGHFYELDREGCVVLSLIVEIATMEHGLARIAESLTAT